MEPEALARLPRLPASGRCRCQAAIHPTGLATAGSERLPLYRCPGCHIIYVAEANRARSKGPAPANPVLDAETARLILQRLKAP